MTVYQTVNGVYDNLPCHKNYDKTTIFVIFHLTFFIGDKMSIVRLNQLKLKSVINIKYDLFYRIWYMIIRMLFLLKSFDKLHTVKVCRHYCQ